jgi:peroxiredoxin
MNRRNFLHAAAATALAASYPTSFAAPIKQSMIGVDSDGKPFDLANYAGKVCLVSFFTSACNLCTHDLKLMREFYFDNRAKNFSLVGVNIDARREDFAEYSHLISLTIPAEHRFPLVWRNSPQHADSFGPIKSQPTHFVLNRNQEQEFKREGSFQPADWDLLWSKL